MAHNLAATLIAGRGVVLEGTTATAAPPTFAQIQAYIAANADATSLPTGFTPLSEMDPGDLPQMETEGGASTVKRTWRVEKARETVTPAVRSFVTKPLQFDNDVMSRYEGGGTFTSPNLFVAPTVSTPHESPLLVIYLDGANPVAEYFGRVSTRSGGSIEHNIDDWSKIPLKHTVLTPTNSNPEHAWIGAHFGTPA